jgi:hypothetical protein
MSEKNSESKQGSEPHEIANAIIDMLAEKGVCVGDVADILRKVQHGIGWTTVNPTRRLAKFGPGDSRTQCPAQK